jgi:Fe2+ transport system protein FeoA
MVKKLNELLVGEKGKVIAIFCPPDMPGFRGRLEAMGLSINCEVIVLRKHWFSPIHVQVGMTELMIRKVDAGHIWIKL